MSYSVVNVTTVYPAHLARVLRHAGTDRGHAAMVEALIASRYGWSDFITRRLRALGNQATEIVFAEPFQQSWAREHGRDPEAELTRLLVDEIRSHAPDILLLEDLYAVGRTLRRQIREAVSGIRLVGWRAAPTEDFAALADLDLLLTSAPSFVEAAKRVGIPSAHVPHAFAPEVLQEFEPGASLPFTFLGTVGHWSGAHGERYRLLDALMDGTPLEVFGHIDPNPWRKNMLRRFAAHTLVTGRRVLPEGAASSRLLTQGPGRRLRHAPSRPTEPGLEIRYPERVHPPEFGLEYYAALAASDVTLNVHIDATGPHVANMRVFEATGVGTCLVTDRKNDLHRYFVPNEEVVVFESAEECASKVLELLKDPTLRQRIAASGQRRTLADHTYDERVVELDSYLRALL